MGRRTASQTQAKTLLRVEVSSDQGVRRLQSVPASSHFRASVIAIRADRESPNTISVTDSEQSFVMPHVNNKSSYIPTGLLPKSSLSISGSSSPQRSPRLNRHHSSSKSHSSGNHGGYSSSSKLPSRAIFPIESQIPLPPSLQRFVLAPVTNRTSPSSQLKTVLRLTQDDLEHVSVHGNSLLLRTTAHTNPKSLTKYNFDHIFSPDSTQQQLCAVCLPDLLQSFFNGSDACFLYFGAASKVKADLLYSLSTSLSGNSPGACGIGNVDSSSGSTASTSVQPSVGMGTAPSYPGLFPSAVLLTFRLINEFRLTRPDFRHSVRLSALYYSQRYNRLTDLLATSPSSFNNPNDSESPVTISEDSALGIKIENHLEVRVESANQAFDYIKQIMRFRTTEEESEQRCGHLFFYINLYRYKTDSSQVIGGRSRLCLIDLGLGERSSKGDMQALTMPVITNLLVALFQGQRHLPSRQSALCMLLKDSLGNVRSKNSVLFASLSDRVSETENIVQMMSKIQRAARPRKSNRVGSDCSSSAESVRRRIVVDSEGNSSSEQSCAETVIFLGPSIKGEPLKVATTPSTKCKTKHELDSEKKKMIMEWMERTGNAPTPIESSEQTITTRSMKVSVHVQCNEEEIDYEMLHHYTSCHHPLHDILEDDEEALLSYAQTPSKESISMNEQFEDSTWNCDGPPDDGRLSAGMICGEGEELILDGDDGIVGHIEHPLSILSLDKTSASTSAKSSSENEVEDDDLERAMAASVSSIRSHEILSRLNDDLPSETNSFTDESTGGASDIYRRASELELYADERLRQMIEMSEKKKKKKLTLNCCQNSMMSSGSSSAFMHNASTPPPLTVGSMTALGPDMLSSPIGRPTLNGINNINNSTNPNNNNINSNNNNSNHNSISTPPISTFKVSSSPVGGVKPSATLPSISGVLTRQIAQQISKFNPKTGRTEPLARSKLPRRTEGVVGSFPSQSASTSKTVITTSVAAEWPSNSTPQQVELNISPAQSITRLPRRETPEGKKDAKKSKRSGERRNSTESENKTQIIPSPYSKVTEAKHDSGAYSSGHGSDENGSVYSRPHVGLLSPRANRPRNRESLSASSGYESASGDSKNYGALTKKRLMETKRNRQPPDSTGEKQITVTEKRISTLIAHQKRLREELREAKHFLGVHDEIFISASNTALQGSTLLEALTQETKILEKRLIACRNHAMLVTCLL